MKTKKFFIQLKAEHLEIPVPPQLKTQIENMAFDFSCGIEMVRVAEVFKEAQKLVAEGYSEEQAPCGI